MESLWKLVYLLEPAPIALILTAIAVSYASAFRALNYGKEMERNRDWSEASITLDSSQALMIPIVSSCSLLMMFYLFSSVSQLLTVFTAVASASSLYFCLFPYIAQIKSRFGLADPFVSRCCSKPFTRIQGLLALLCIGTAIPSMLLALVLCFDHRKSRDSENIIDIPLPKGFYIWYALAGYSLGLVTALAAGILTHSPQPALLYLVPSTLGPIIVISWMRKELAELWEGSPSNINEKTHLTEV